MLATVLLALSYGLVACLWGLALHRAAGTRVAAGARIWFLSNLARYVPGNVWSYVGAVELARREGVARRTTLAVMALTQVLSVGVALLAGLPVLLAERARLGRPALLGAVVVAAGAALAALFRRQLLGLARRRLPGFDPAGLTPSAGTVAWLVAGYAVYWAVTGLAFAALVASLYPLAPADVPVVVAAYAAAYAAGFLALLTPAGLGVREGVLVVALAPVLPAGPALVVALLSRVWMMLVELAGAGVAHLVDRSGPRCKTAGRAVLDWVRGTVATREHGGAAVRAVRDEVGARPGSQERFTGVFRERYRELYGLGYRLLGDHGEAEDVVQETFLKLDGHPVLDRPDEEVAAWLRRVCLNTAYNRLRGRRRTTARLERAGRAERADDEADAGATPLLDVLRAEQQRAVRQALASLPERQRACLLLRHAGYSYAEIAATLDLAVGSVGVLLARGERAFREAYLDSDDPDPGAHDALP